MPIKPENRSRYPRQWGAIRAAILVRADNCCEWPGCGVSNRSVGIWKAGVFFKLADSRLHLDARTAIQMEVAGDRLTEIVLTVAHLDHTPEHCDQDNLRAWCQRHHLAYDQEHHVTTAYMTRRERACTMELPI
jgi:hypothetical protein